METGAGMNLGSIGEKTKKAIEKTCDYLHYGKENLLIRGVSRLPMGKGMASSSADISAACQAVAIIAGQRLSADEIGDLALSIEPTDGIFYSGIMMFDHITGKIRTCLGSPPKLDIVVIDCGGSVDTLIFNQRKDLKRLNREKEEQIQEAVELVKVGIQKQSVELIGQGATISAIANQTMLYKKDLAEIIAISRHYGAVGVNAAHSGTVLGILMPTGNREGIRLCVEEIHLRCPNAVQIMTTQLMPGGLVVEEGESNDGGAWR